ncbi:TetR family transcriptional regulator [Frigoribacterium sp. PhB160]|nr:TetR family transcriptional regulator [Frigoribacterium sp. PhB160]
MVGHMPSDGRVPVSRPPRAEVRERLLDAATALISQRGVHATTLDDVARAAGFSKGAVYSNFASKSELVVTLLTRETEGALDALREMGLPGTDLADLPGAVRDAFAPYAQSTADDFSLMSEFRAHALEDDVVMAAFVAKRRAVLDTLREQVELVFGGQTEAATGLSSDLLARLLIDVALGSAFDAPATGDVGPGELMGHVVGALTRSVLGRA